MRYTLIDSKNKESARTKTEEKNNNKTNSRVLSLKTKIFIDFDEETKIIKGSTKRKHYKYVE